MPIPTHVRPALPVDAADLRILIDHEFFTHRHLDWRNPLDWLGHPPFWLIESGKRIIAALACQEDPPGIAWIRLFTATADLDITEAWAPLFTKVNEHYRQKPSILFSSLSFQDWYSRLLECNGFAHNHDIVVLERNETSPLMFGMKSGIPILQMLESDLEAACEIDKRAFARLWQLSPDSFSRTFQDSVYSTVAKLDNKVVGYQITSGTYQGGHLARLAVLPEVQNKGLGTDLVIDVMKQLESEGIHRLSVNTQSTNKASLTVYHRLGFEETGEIIPVYLSQPH